MKKAAAALAVTSLFVTAPGFAGDFSNTYFFGDSLTDSGYYRPLLPPGTGKFTTNPGPVWAEILAESLGKQAAPANTPGGTNYAQGGARVDSTPGIGGGPALGAQPISAQISAYLAANGGRADGSALYTVWAGANDIFAAASGAASAAQGTVIAAASADIAQIARLQAAGARYIVVPSLPDMGRTPQGQAAGAAGAAGLTALSSGYNQYLFGNLAVSGLSIIPADTFALLREVSASPAAYGFSNISSVACTTSSSLVCTSQSLAAPNAAQTYLYADGVHPTSAGHALMAQYVGSLLAAPGEIALLAESPLQTRQALVRTIGDQARISNSNRAVGTNRFWVSGDVGRYEYDSSSAARGAKGTPLAATFGIDRKLADNFLGGVAVSVGRYSPDFGGGHGGYTQNELALSAFGQYTNGPWRVDAVGTLGHLNYDVNRNIALGAMTRTQSGSTTGDSVSMSLLGGYEMSAGNVTHGPFGGLLLQTVDVDGFSDGSDSTALSFRKQTRRSTLGTLGYRASMQAGNYTPFGSIAWNHEFRSGERVVGAMLTTMTAPAYSLPVLSPKRDWATLAGGVSMRLGQTATGYVSASVEAGRSNVTNYGIQAGVSIPF